MPRAKSNAFSKEGETPEVPESMEVKPDAAAAKKAKPPKATVADTMSLKEQLELQKMVRDRIAKEEAAKEKQ